VPLWAWALLGALVVLLSAVTIAFAPIVRAKVRGEALRRDLDVDVGRVRPGFFAVRLLEVHVRPRHVDGVEARLDEVRVELSAFLSARRIVANGGDVRLDGEPDDLAERWRAGRREGPDGGAERSSTLAVSVEAISATWTMPQSGTVSGTGVRFARADGTTRIGCAKCSAAYARDGRTWRVDLGDAELALGRGNIVEQVRAASLDVIYTPPPAPKVDAVSPASELTPAPLPVASKKKGAARPPEPPPPSTPVLPFPDLHALRAKIASGVVLAARLPDGARVEIPALSVRVEERDPIEVGPGSLHVARERDHLRIGFVSGESPGHTPLSLDADLPLGPGDMTARLAGGPVPIAALGAKEGMRGLVDVQHGRIEGKGQLVLSAAADALTFDGEVSLKNLSLKEARLAPEVLRGIDLGVSASGVLDDAGRLRLDDAQLDMGALHLRGHGRVEETADQFSIALGLDVAPAACQSLLDSAPQGLLPTVRAARMSGTFAANATLAFDTRTIDKLALDYRIDDHCHMTEVPPDLAQDRFTGSFTYRTYRPDGTNGETTTGPGTPAWTGIDDISPYMIAAVLTTEDGAFYRHHGFNHSAIRSSIAANLKARRFVRGASTITMQLAKNLFLARDKALSRKIEEVVLTAYLEQVFRKEDLMELYLNVIEFGPNVYGITQAAEYYYGRKPNELHVGECFFLASLLPSPLRFAKLRDRGEVPEGWQRHLHTLMEIAAKNGKISRPELEEALREPIVFVRPGDPRPAPRKPVTGTRRDGFDEEDAAWRPLD
jgi:hypothetical protein